MTIPQDVVIAPQIRNMYLQLLRDPEIWPMPKLAIPAKT